MKRLFITTLLMLVLPLVLSAQGTWLWPKDPDSSAHWSRPRPPILYCDWSRRPMLIEDWSGGICVCTGDLDGDGDEDIIGTASGANEIAWFENDGEGNFGTKRTIESNYSCASFPYAADLDGDGDLDVGARDTENINVHWWENDGSGNFTERIIPDTTGHGKIIPLDLDNDNDNDLLSRPLYGVGPLIWYENDGSGNFTFHVIPESDTTNDCFWIICPADLDRDGDVDILGGNPAWQTVYWFENDGGSPPYFTRHEFEPPIYSPSVFHATDLDSDGDEDILIAGMWSRYILWFENREDIMSESPIVFTEHVIAWGGVPQGATTIYSNDFDHDMDTDFMISYDYWVPDDDTTIIWFENNGDEYFVRHLVDTEAYGEYICGGYIDNDDYPDIVGASSWPSYNSICWWRNQLGYASIPPRPAGGESPPNNTLVKVIQTTGVVESGSVTPALFSFGLKSNPIKGKAIFNLALPRDASVTLQIYDASGRLVATPTTGNKSAGNHTITWTPSTNGTYFYSFESSNHKESGKLVIIK